ncbi:MAG: hypothetical protein QM644_15060 [Mobilitalea sp.]
MSWKKHAMLVSPDIVDEFNCRIKLNCHINKNNFLDVLQDRLESQSWSTFKEVLFS